MGNYTWSRSKDDELWRHDVFETEKECVEDAVKNYDFEIGDTIAIGTTCAFIPSLCAETILEDVENNAFDECGEVAEDWINFKDKENLEVLSARLTECLVQWLKETKQEPSFYKIEDIKTIEIK